MGAKKRGRKIRMKNNQNKRGMKVLYRQIRAARDMIALQCFIHGHDKRNVPALGGDVCIRCGENLRQPLDSSDG